MKIFSLALADMNYLLSLTLQGNLLDDEMIRWLSLGLISNYTIRFLDLSNNYITCTGMMKLSSYLLRSRCLLTLDLSNNQVSLSYLDKFRRWFYSIIGDKGKYASCYY